METPTQQIPAVDGTSPIACAACGAKVESGQRYCLACGEPVTAVPEAPVAASAPAQPRSGGVTPGVAAACVCLAVLFLAVGILVGRLSFGDSVNGSKTNQQNAPAQQNGAFNGGTTLPSNGTQNTVPTPPDGSSSGGGTNLPGSETPPASNGQQTPPPANPAP